MRNIFFKICLQGHYGFDYTVEKRTEVSKGPGNLASIIKQVLHSEAYVLNSSHLTCHFLRLILHGFGRQISSSVIEKRGEIYLD